MRQTLHRSKKNQNKKLDPKMVQSAPSESSEERVQCSKCKQLVPANDPGTVLASYDLEDLHGRYYCQTCWAFLCDCED